MHIKRSIKLALRTDGDAKDEKKYRPLKIRISYDGNRVDMPTGFSIKAPDWDAVSGKMKPGKTDAKGVASDTVNEEIAGILSAIAEAFKTYELNRVVPTPDELRDWIRSKLSPNYKKDDAKSQQQSLDAAFKRFIYEHGPTMAWSQNTYKVFNTIYKDLNAYHPNIKFRNLDEKGLAGYLSWLRFEKKVIVLKRSGDKKGELGLKDSTIKKHLSTLRTFLRWAEAKGYPVPPAYRTFRPRYRPVTNPVIYLTENEIAKVWKLDIPNGETTLRHCRDILVFCCYTGLRYSDVANLRRGDLHDKYFDVTTIKTSDSVRIDYNKVSKAILDRYADTPLPGNKALPVISNQKMNDAVKDVCKMAHIDTEVLHVYNKGDVRREVRGPKWKFISTHTGRRSFICNGLAKGIPPHIMMKWTGHSSYATMKPYIDAVDSVRAKEMKKFDKVSFMD